MKRELKPGSIREDLILAIDRGEISYRDSLDLLNRLFPSDSYLTEIIIERYRVSLKMAMCLADRVARLDPGRLEWVVRAIVSKQPALCSLKQAFKLADRCWDSAMVREAIVNRPDWQSLERKDQEALSSSFDLVIIDGVLSYLVEPIEDDDDFEEYGD